MAITNKLKNIYGLEISNEQANMLVEYFDEKLINGEVKKIDVIENKLVERTYYYYYLDDSESISSLLPTYQNKKVSFYNVSYVNNYKVEDIYSYENGVLKGRSKSILNNQKQLICYQKLDLITNQIINNATQKFYYENNKSRYTFEYDEFGNCFMIHDNMFAQEDIFAWDIGANETSFTWQGFEYYQQAQPLIPSLV